MPKSTPKMLPGEVIAQRVRCGKQACKCSRGELHTAFYRYWTENGRQRKAYVRWVDLEGTRAAVARWKEADDAKASILNSPDSDRTRAEMRANLRAALGEQIDTPGGQRQLRRLRSRSAARE